MLPKNGLAPLEANPQYETVTAVQRIQSEFHVCCLSGRLIDAAEAVDTGVSIPNSMN